MKQNRGVIFGFLKPYRWHALAAAAAMLLTSTAVLAMGQGLKHLIDEGLSKGDERLLDHAFFVLLAATFLLAIATYVRFFLVSWIGERVVADIRRALYARLLALPQSFHETTRTGDLISRLTTDTTLLQTVIGSSLSLAARNVLLLIGGGALLIVTSMKLTAYMLLIVPIVVAPIVVIGRRVRVAAREAQARVSEISAHAEEALSAIRTVQAMNLEAHVTQQFSERIAAALSVALLRIRTRASLTAMVIALVFGAVVTVLWLGGRDMLEGEISAGALSSFIFYSVIVAGAVGALSEVASDIQRALGAADRLAELLQTPLEQHGVPDSSVAVPTGAVAVDFEAVSFAYPARPARKVLNGVSFSVAAGETVALVGASGAGKTTLFQLLLGFYTPSSGSIAIGGVESTRWPVATLRSFIGLVPQEPAIFRGTLAENIRLGRMDATDAEVEKAAGAANVLEFAVHLSEGLATQVGEKGVQLSGGQKQRVAIARALLRDPALLLLDEATSALDSENEHAITQALEVATRGRTTLIIAHRFATAMKADRIVLLEQGNVEAIGTHAELMHSNAHYRRLAELQLTS